MSQTAIRAKIKEKLLAHCGEGLPIKEVYAEHRTDFGGYPVATFEPSAEESDYETTTQNLRKYIYRIVLWQEAQSMTGEGALDILIALSETIIADFDEDFTLGGVCDFCNAVPAIWGQWDSPTGIVRYTEIKLECNKSETI
jgi:hypothetical protein